MNDDARSVTGFYDDLADDYHLIFADWRRSVRAQGTTLHDLIQSQWGEHIHTVLDCSCGIGTQAIGLALQGYKVHATDISTAAVARAEREASSFGVSLSLGVADMRALEVIEGTFDLVVSCDNALPHLLDDIDLIAAARSIRSKLVAGGGVLLSIRDYDHLVAERPTLMPLNLFDGTDGRTVTFQLWRWAADGRTYTVEQFILHEHERAWQTTHAATTYRALQRGELTAILERAGFADVRWHMPDASGYYQPIVTATAVAF